MTDKERTFSTLAKAHFKIDRGVKQVFRLLAADGREENKDEPVKLLEVNKDTPQVGIVPTYFGPDPKRGIQHWTVIVEVTPTEFRQIRSGELKLAGGWQLGPEYKRRRVKRV